MRFFRLLASRASTATALLYTSSSASFTTYGTNVPRLVSGSGLLIEEQRTNLLLNSGTPATQTVTLSATGSYTLWMIGTGSVTSAAGTATGTGFGTASQGTPNTFTITATGTVSITVSGSPSVQLEAGAFPTSYIPTTSSTATRAADVATVATSAFAYKNAGSVVVAFQGNNSFEAADGVVIGDNAGINSAALVQVPARWQGSSSSRGIAWRE